MPRTRLDRDLQVSRASSYRYLDEVIAVLDARCGGTTQALSTSTGTPLRVSDVDASRVLATDQQRRAVQVDRYRRADGFGTCRAGQDRGEPPAAFEPDRGVHAGR